MAEQSIDTGLRRLSNEALRESLDKTFRYRTSLVAQEGRDAYDARVQLLTDEMVRRKLAFEPLPETPRCTLRPLADQVVVLPTQEADVTEGGIIVPDSAKAVPHEGVVLAVGPGVPEAGLGIRSVTLQVGDRVLFGRYSGLEFVLDGQKVLIMPERDVLGVLT